MVVHILILVISQVALTSAFQWTSGSILPNGTAVPACPGQDVTLAWSYTTAADEHLNNVEWYFIAPGGSHTLMATYVAGNFLATPSFSQRVQFLPNAGIRLLNVAVAEKGTYSVHLLLHLHGSLFTQEQTVEVQVSDQPLTTDRQLHVEMLADAVYDNSTQQFHVQLACGHFLPVWQSRARVVWKTPSEQTVPSTSYDNGRFLLSLPNPVVSGEYACVIDDTSPASLCVQSGTPLHRGATVSVDGVQAQFVIVNADMTALRQKNTALGQQMTSVQQKNLALETQLAGYHQENTAVRQQLDFVLQKNVALETQLTGYHQENTALRQQLESVQRNLTSMIEIAGKSISFNAFLGARGATLNSRDTLVFEQVLHNEGNAYNSYNGVFTAPVDGAYAFFVTIATDGASPLQATRVYMQAEGNVFYICEAYSVYDGNYKSGSCSAVTSLQAGQHVSVKSYTNSSRYYSSASFFSGALLHAALP